MLFSVVTMVRGIIAEAEDEVYEGKPLKIGIIQESFLHLTHLCVESQKRDIGKEYRPRSDAAERGVWSGSTYFALI